MGMNQKNVIASLLSVSLFTGCNQDDAIRQNQDLLVQLNNTLLKQQTALSKISLSDDARIANALVSSSKLSSIAAYLMLESNTTSMTEDIKNKVLYASQELANDQLQQRMYQSLMANGLPAFYSVDIAESGVKKYVVRGQWHLDATSGSEFYLNYPEQALELLPYERIYFPENMCSEGYEPFIIHSLLRRSASSPIIEPSVVQLRNGLQVFVKGVDYYESIKNYRVLVDVRCKEVESL